jgi:membrane-associated phospholipid phosphatase
VPSSRTVLDPEPDRLAERTAVLGVDHHPAAVTGAVVVVGYVVLSAVMLALGVLLTHASAHTVGSWDRDTTRWLADHRTAPLDEVTKYATFTANTEAVVAVAGVVTLWLLLRHRWREAIFLMGGLTLELTVFLSANFLVDRPRPDVPRLNTTPATSSFPSGHAAASVVLWVALALTVGVVATGLVVRVVAWLPVVFLPVTIAFARVYRGMHNPTDVMAGIVLGIMCLAVACFAARVWTAATARRTLTAAAHERVPLTPAGAP